ncbi:MAG: ABC transporter substrate-binding protein [Firmicutes bacterium]|nr:ABC transporter substrate-binding protein [Bacillota bacterium]
MESIKQSINREKMLGGSGLSRRTRIMTALLAALLLTGCLICFAGCGAGGGGSAGPDPGSPAVSENGDPAGTVVSETKEELTVVDQAGREVTVKKDPQSIALCYRVVIRFLLSLDQGDKIKGIGKSEPFLEQLQPSLADCADVGKGVADIEALAQLGPDLFVHKASDVQTLEAVSEIGIPSVGIEVETPEDMVCALDLLGKVCGAEDKAAELIDYYNGQIRASEDLVSQIDDADKPTAIVMGTSIGKVADGSMLQGEMLERAGAVNCAADLKATELWPTAGTEQIFAWDPDYIFITNSESAVYTAEDLLQDPAWSELTAVREKHIYEMPAEADSWEFPGVVSTLGIDYMMHIMHPQLLDEETLKQHVDALYQLCYGRTFERDELGY